MKSIFLPPTMSQDQDVLKQMMYGWLENCENLNARVPISSNYVSVPSMWAKLWGTTTPRVFDTCIVTKLVVKQRNLNKAKSIEKSILEWRHNIRNKQRIVVLRVIFCFIRRTVLDILELYWTATFISGIRFINNPNNNQE